jgi:hypothetical protein
MVTSVGDMPEGVFHPTARRGKSLRVHGSPEHVFDVERVPHAEDVKD